MKELLAKIFALFKANNIELTPDQQADLNAEAIKAASQKPATGTDLKIPEGMQHNVEFFNEALRKFEAKMDEERKQYAESMTALQKQNEDLIKMLGEERQAREAGIKAMDDKLAAEKTAKIDSLITEMKKDGRLPAQNAEVEEKYRKMLETDFETTVSIIDNLPKTTETKTEEKINGKDGSKVNYDDPLASILTPQSQKELETTPLVKSF